ncbi:M23 family metallopeptidase [Halobacillus shinanisalinarum]|uniref:M23 family metallopeptidase n=1 Tax=Halobacillus shinanisalinarum TaxID=2932258 RepID=A0ABY4H0A2_9BACI|nr:M23 family metallopeptidase [Halobacillus shinanisalinarum]UOQ93867.1 M23 family metallopeptidase [Halobacillus shinanisalinarum]
MNRNIEHVRKNIAERKRHKVKSTGYEPVKRRITPPQEEEMHGYPPLVTGEFKPPLTTKKRTSFLGVQVLFSVLLFTGVVVSEKTDLAITEQPEAWVVSQLEEEFPFASVTAWYNERFGDPLQIVQQKEGGGTAQLALPVNGTVKEPFQNHGRGIIMTTDGGSEVKAVKPGTIIFAGNDEQTDKTIIVQHKDGTNTIYGFLSAIDVHLYQHIEAQEAIGQLNTADGETKEFFFAVKKDEQYLDPVEVIKVDEGSD